MTPVSRYHPLLVALHWILAVLIMAALTLGALVMVKIPNTSPMKFEALRSHMLGGTLILVLMLVRLVVQDANPASGRGLGGTSVVGSTGLDFCIACSMGPCSAWQRAAG